MSRTNPPYMSHWSERPLCRRYAAVVVDRVVVREAARQREGQVFGWALGTLSDGQAEVLGWWEPSQPASIEWRSVGDRLAARGVEHIGVIVDDSDVVTGLDASSVMRVVVPSCCAEANKPAPTLPPHVRRHIARARATAKRVQTALSRALRRGRIGETSAAALLDEALQKIDRQLPAQRAPTVRRSGVSAKA
jgi:Transposase, Mutator family